MNQKYKIFCMYITIKLLNLRNKQININNLKSIVNEDTKSIK